jgi:hypothetical protein
MFRETVLFPSWGVSGGQGWSTSFLLPLVLEEVKPATKFLVKEELALFKLE